MRQIHKSAEPASLTQHRSQPHATYENFQDKDGLRNSLTREQLFLCCYCSGRLVADPAKMKIEHFACQTDHPSLQLNYSNLLGACLGGQGQAEREQHCDTRKGSRALYKSPASSTNIENFVTYSGDGTISSTDSTFRDELNDVLNLNQPTLKQNRKKTLDSFLEGIEKKHKGTLTKEQWKTYLSKYQGSSGTIELTPYAPVISYYIRRKLR